MIPWGKTPNWLSSKIVPTAMTTNPASIAPLGFLLTEFIQLPRRISADVCS
jgi:hypothetical protein